MYWHITWAAQRLSCWSSAMYEAQINYAGARLSTRVGWVTAKTTGFTEQYMELNKGTTK